MKRRALGCAGLEVAPLALGTVKFGRTRGLKHPHPFALPDDRELRRLLELAAASGVNLLDTAPAYGSSEQRIGALLSDRQRWVLSTKAGERFDGACSHFDFRPAAIRASVERSLRALRTDYLDIVLIHSDGRDVEIIERFEVFDTLRSLREAGWIRAYGMSVKTLEGGLRTVAEADVAMVSYNLDDPSMRSVLAAAAREGRGVLIKKALASGHLCGPGGPALVEIFDDALGLPGVTSVVVGTINPEHLAANVAAVRAVVGGRAT